MSSVEAQTTGAERERQGWRMLDISAIRHPPDTFVSFVIFAIILVLLVLVTIGMAMLARASETAFMGTPDDLNKLLLGLGGLVGAPFFIWRVLIAAQQTSIAREAHYTSLFTKAVEHLGAMREVKETIKSVDHGGSSKIDIASRTVPNIESRIGAIYALERIAQDSLRDEWPIIETLCAYIRENAGPALLGDLSMPITESDANEEARPSTDIRAALNVIFRRRILKSQTLLSRELDLEGIDLRGSRIEDAEASLANFIGSNLAWSQLSGSNLRNSKMQRANLYRSVLYNVSLVDAKLNESNMSHSFMQEANLSNADLSGAALDGAWLGGANMASCSGLTQGQIDRAFGDSLTRIPSSMSFPRHWLRADSSPDERDQYLLDWSTDPEALRSRSL